jgi:HPt (histidine-containing phosphotransfer) domain-containing protein
MVPRIVIAARPDLADTIRPFLSGPDGWEILDAPTPEAAWTISIVPPPDALLIATPLFETVGRVLAERLRGPRESGRTILVLLAMGGETAPHLPAGVAAVLTAPFEAGPLAHQVRQAIDQARFQHHLGRLEKLGGGAFVREMVELFLDLTPGRIATLRTAIEGGNLDAVRFSCHQMKSSAANLGALLLYDLANEGEALAAAGEKATLGDLLERIETAYDQGRQLLQAQVPTQGNS